MKILVCGGRDFVDRKLLNRTLMRYRDTIAIGEPLIIIHGDAEGADRMAGYWAGDIGAQEVKCPANWSFYGKVAGPMRNAYMLELKPDVIVAFPGGRGTADMIRKATRAGIRVHKVDDTHVEEQRNETLPNQGL